MTITQFLPDKSTRGKILYDKIKPHIKDGMHFIDIGCAYAPLADHIRKDFPTATYFGFDSAGQLLPHCMARHPHYTWKRILVEEDSNFGVWIKDPIDFVLHIGVDADYWTAIWKVHQAILAEDHKPQFVLLETGRKDGYEKCMDTLNRITTLYIEAGYKLVDTGQFDFDVDEECLRDRWYFILKKQ